MPQLSASQITFGSRCRLGANTTEHDGQTFTVSSVTVTIKSLSGTVLRNAVTASSATPPAGSGRTGFDVYYVETFTAANGYAEDTDYIATFTLTLSCGGTTFVEYPEVAFRLAKNNIL